MKPHFILALAVLPLAACSGAASNNAQPPATSGAAAGSQANVTMSGTATVEGNMSIEPGQWEMRVTLEEMDMPGAPPAAIEQMKQTLAARVERTCFTPEDVANMGRRMIEASNEGMNCQFNNQVFGGGRVDIAGTCQGQGSTVEMTMQGTYTPTTMQTRNVMSTTAQGQTVRMVVTGNGQRVGECPAGEPQETPKE